MTSWMVVGIGVVEAFDCNTFGYVYELEVLCCKRLLNWTLGA
jgi:hypothetical protein